MVAILFIVMTDRESQLAYRLLMNTRVKFLPFQVKGKNVRERLKKYKIDQVPTLFITTSKKKYVGAAAIQNMLEQIVYNTNDRNGGREDEPVKNKIEDVVESSEEGAPKIPRRDDSQDSQFESYGPTSDDDSRIIRPPVKKAKEDNKPLDTSKQSPVQTDYDDDEEMIEL
uniref:Thioredoxin domain-containing protein n=1 Tax=viral metagenome TaxID=1070528 RepID=A0A6C0JRH1_9ZZZZ